MNVDDIDTYPNPPNVQPNLLPRWQPNLQPNLQLESPFLWPLLSMCSSLRCNTRVRKSGFRVYGPPPRVICGPGTARDNIRCTYTVITDPARLAEHLRRTCKSEHKKKRKKYSCQTKWHTEPVLTCIPAGSFLVRLWFICPRVCSRTSGGGGGGTGGRLPRGCEGTVIPSRLLDKAGGGMRCTRSLSKNKLIGKGPQFCCTSKEE